MPITITPFEPSGVVGPGLSIDLVTDFVGPLTSDTFWQVAITTDSEDINSGLLHNYFLNHAHVTPKFFTRDPLSGFSINSTGQPNAGDTVHVLAQLVQGSTVIDSGAITATYSPTLGLGQQALVHSGKTSGDFTAADRATMTTGLTDILNSVTAQIETATGTVQHSLAELFTRQTLDRLTLQEITDGETFDPVSAGVDSWYFGVIVRVTTVPDALRFADTDPEWFYPDLAVLRIRRGEDVEYRKGIHTRSWLASAPWGYNLQLLNLAFFDTPPPDTTIEVDWAFGCGGQVFLMAWP